MRHEGEASCIFLPTGSDGTNSARGEKLMELDPRYQRIPFLADVQAHGVLKQLRAGIGTHPKRQPSQKRFASVQYNWS